MVMSTNKAGVYLVLWFQCSYLLSVTVLLPSILLKHSLILHLLLDQPTSIVYDVLVTL